MTENRTVFVGVVRTSWWADTMHLPALQTHPNAENNTERRWADVDSTPAD